MEIIEDQIFEAEVEEAGKAYQIGDYQTIQECITNQSVFLDIDPQRVRKWQITKLIDGGG
ncbi:hypothetical protein NIES3804_31020 [Microcystis aeruginosa NIES-3804]|uniref:Uncharacterized protein n=1 Tax=Microcystis aeruginosa NIES-3804 TaxID=2517783 RepID=A0A6H9GZ53_MICAE|nr:hypothetical protein [Microcystis aeruginosa]GCL51522.1 hypothetical protein NIES3804_31020 [Microcystis aeruginosa NIES-3804]